MITAAPTLDAATIEPQPGPFISYSRRDRDFARRLVHALRTRNRDAWVDLEGIEPSEEWLKKLHAAIDAAPAFVFIISPDSATSRHCEDEIRYAAESKKKLIPILSREVNPEVLPEALARIQWISFLDDARFDECVDELIRALDTDLEWNARHTRLLVRAREWGAARDKSLLLRGTDLDDAERWLLDSGSRQDRRPAALQTEYIGASVKAEKRFRTRLLSSVTGAAVIAIGLAAVAVYQRNVAQENEQQALSRQLAAQAQGIVDRDLGLSMLLAVTAFQRRPTFEAKQAMSIAMRHRPHLQRFLPGHGARIHQLSFDERGGWLASSATDGRIILWDVATGRAALTLQSTSAAPAIAVHSARDLFVTSGDSGSIQLRRLADGAILDDLSTGTHAPVTHLAFDPVGSVLAGGTRDGALLLFDVESRGQRCSAPSRSGADVTALRFDSAGLRLAAIDRAGGVHWLAVRDCSSDVASAEAMSGEATALSADLSRAIALDPGPPEVRLFETRTRQLAAHDIADANGFLLSALGLAADTFALGVQDGEVLLWNASSKRTQLRLRGHRSDVTALGFDAASRTLASGSMNGEVILWDLDREAPIEPVRTIPIAAAHVAFTMDGRSLLVVDRTGAARLWDVASLEQIAELPVWPASQKVAVSAQAERFATLTDSAIVVRGWRDRAPTDSVGVSSSPEEIGFALSPDGGLLGYVDEGHVLLRDLLNHATDTVALQASGSSAIAFSVAGDALLSVAKGDTVISYDVRSRAVTRLAIPGDKGPVQSVARRDALIVTGGNLYDGNVLLWDVASRSVMRTLSSGELYPVAHLLFSPDGGTIGAVSSFAETLYLWDVATGQRTLGPVRLEERAGESLGFAFSPDGSLLASVEPGAIVLRELDARRWAAAICRTVNRDLTLEEWRGYVGPYDFVPTCGNVSSATPSRQ